MPFIKFYFFMLSIVICSGQIEFPDYSKHPCKRPCNGTKMKCSYDFTLERMYSMETYNCKECLGQYVEDCYNPNCVVVDGNQKFIYTINRRIPGPQIEVCKGDITSVMVTNHLVDATTTIHWHGQHQRRTPYMDGVPMITQCPIQPGAQFLYEFEATDEGTHFYHSHAGFQRTDGISGALIVKVPDEDNAIRDQYDFDISGHVIQVTDWLLNNGMEDFFTTYREKTLGNINSAILINGFGSTTQNTVPTPMFTVKKGFKYRFRLIHSGSTSCPIHVNIDNHELIVVSVDGNDITPQPVDVITITDGERYDFIVSTNQVENFYWIKATGSSQCRGLESLALLKYQASNVTEVPLKDSAVTPLKTNATEMNCVNVPSNTVNCYTLANITSVNEMDSDLSGKPDFKYIVGYAMNKENLPVFRDSNTAIANTPAFNNICNLMPSTNLLQPEQTVPFCNRENLNGCDPADGLCQCTHIVNIPNNAIVELILVNEQYPLDLVHPIHLHGNSFRILSHESFGRNTSVAEIEDLDSKGLLRRNYDRPLLKDTISVPHGGYSILRFRADNPGYWFMHCHLEFHVEIGMAMTWKVGTPADPPSNFPRCGDYTESIFDEF